jgi:hypothetical protein
MSRSSSNAPARNSRAASTAQTIISDISTGVTPGCGDSDASSLVVITFGFSDGSHRAAKRASGS